MKTALITGASSGIGLELTKILAEHHNHLVLIARNHDKLIDLKKELETIYKINILIITQDLSQENAAAKIFQITQEANITIDYLINNAGFGECGYFSKTDWQKEADMIQVNITALCQLSKLYLTGMQARQQGKILNIASIVAFQASPLMSIYGASKAFVLSFSEALNEEVRRYGISVTAFCPGPTESGFQEVANMAKSGTVRGKKYVSAKVVAQNAYQAMLQGKTVVIDGYFNRLLITLGRLSPRSAIVKISRFLIERAQ